ncbi:TolC family protein [Corallincola holothuriorum]|uniref:TolC family protein n=1 Tax=Corallincola holothuriorum TaxID=2282215 RepID=A0A368NND4_9GAMM|nr:TolC family protein [Corallincola holothuriorum]RCU51174.1 TolC family protein [Corallincola holothuriorum]
MTNIFFRRLYGAIRCFPLGVLCALFLNSQALGSDWNNWLAIQISQHPDVRAAKERWQGTNANADAMKQPIYNPELSAGADRNGDDNNYAVGLQQTIDLWDRRTVNVKQAAHLKTAAMHTYKQQVLDKTAEVVAALVQWHSANLAARIAKAQQAQFYSMLELLDTRQKSGDLGTVDAELTFLSLSQQITQVAEVESSLLQAEVRLRELLPKWTKSRGGLPESFWPSTIPVSNDERLRLHPLVASTEAAWRSLKENTESARRAAKADPTFGINAGRDGGDSLVGLTVSVPLHVRNDFTAETRLAQSLELEAEATWIATFQKQRVDWDAARASWKRYEYHLKAWEDLLANRVENSEKLLERQWQSGDLSTPNYLSALNQRTESLLAGIELEKQAQLALTEALYQSGQLTTLIQPVN